MLPKGNMQALMKQAQEMQKKMEEAQKELETMEVRGSAGGGMVNVVANGKKEVKSIKIEPEIFEEDPEMIEDMILAAVNQAMQKVDELTQDRMGSITGGMNLPGF
ncbi:MAG: YbaB/EbfC family nucleoid-associated protein [Candidatus Marinimicrobia bacterium]|nr:YbaB/EbfC family nucleoid-associated protein [Candidatus Neomarinimicrobiota bacterium]